MSKDIEDEIEEKAQENDNVTSETKEYTEEFDDETEEKDQENVEAAPEAKECAEEDLADPKDIENEMKKKFKRQTT